MIRKWIIKYILKQPFKSMADAWQWLDGKKTYIAFTFGALGLAINIIDKEFFVGIWLCGPILHLNQIVASCNWIALKLGGVGIGHKILKSSFGQALNTPVQTKEEQPS